jgi:hypothetical protein
MSTTLLTTGLVCVIAAIIGGGCKAFGLEIPIIGSAWRQGVLGAFGLLLIAAYLVQQSDKSQPPPISDSRSAGLTVVNPAPVKRQRSVNRPIPLTDAKRRLPSSIASAQPIDIDANGSYNIRRTPTSMCLKEST